MRKILIVDDEKNIVLTLKMFLIKKGYEVRVATNGIEAIEIALEFVPNLIFLDILMPKMNGYLVCRGLREDLITKDIPIIFISAKSQKSDIQNALAMGGTDYIIKPFTIEQIKDILEKYIKEAE